MLAAPAFENYTVLGSIGAGGMAELFLAERAGVEGARRRVVLKRILPAYAADPDFRELFAHEARIAMQLNHANVVQVFDFRESADSYLLEMEYVEGCDVRRLLRAHGPLPLGAALHVCAEILRGLDYAHRRLGGDGMPLQIVHRDVSPGNILLSREGEVKLTDFGLARSTDRGRSVGGVKGTFAFMAPEQAEGGVIDARADVFAAGAVLYALLVGESPFEADGPVATLDRVREARYEPVTRRVPYLPRVLDGLLARALAHSPDQRFASAAAMREAVIQVAAQEKLALRAEEVGELVRKVAPPQIQPAALNDTEPSLAAIDDGEGQDDFRESQPPTVDLTGAPAPAHGGTQVAQRRPRPAQRRSRALPLAVVALVVAGAAAVLGFYRPGVFRRPTPLTPADPRPAQVAHPKPAAPAAPAAPIGQPAPPAPTVDEKGVVAPEAAVEHPGAHHAKSFLTISADPWATVTIDGKDHGSTPVRAVPLSPGNHLVMLQNDRLGALITEKVRLAPGEHRTLIKKMKPEGR